MRHIAKVVSTRMLLVALVSWALAWMTTLLPALPFQAEGWLQMILVGFASGVTAVACMYGWVWFIEARRQSRAAARARKGRRTLTRRS